LNFALIDVAADYPDPIAIGAGLIAQTAQEIRAFRRQSKRDRCFCHVERKRLPSRSFMRSLETSLIIPSLNL